MGTTPMGMTLRRPGLMRWSSAVERGQAPGVVAAVARGEMVHVAAAGVMTVGGAPMRRDTLFRTSSMTKPMTAATVLSLVDDGLLELNGPVDELLPELADRRVLCSPDGPLGQTVPAERPVTVRDLLTFTWGFGMQGAMFMAPEPWPIFTAALERELSTFGPPQPAAMPDPDTWMARLVSCRCCPSRYSTTAAARGRADSGRRGRMCRRRISPSWS